MAKNEAVILKEILHAMGRRNDCRAWRMNTGAIKHEGRFLTFGLKGSADITGILTVGGVGIRIEVEAKTDRRGQTPAQKNFERMIDCCGGIYILCRSAEDIDEQIDKAKSKITNKIKGETV